MKEIPKYCMVASDSKQVRFIKNFSLPTSSSHRLATCAALAMAMNLIQSQSHFLTLLKSSFLVVVPLSSYSQMCVFPQRNRQFSKEY